MFDLKSCIGGITSRCLLGTVLLLASLAMTSVAMAAEPVHGVGGGKSCTRIPRTCDTDNDCDPSTNECSENVCNTNIPDTLRCIIEVRYNDGFGDTLTITEVFDEVHAFGGDVRQPPAGNAEIISVDGDTTCTVGGALPCTMGPLDGINTVVQFVVDTYAPTKDDPNPLDDTATISYTDSCTGTDPIPPNGNCVVNQPDKLFNGTSSLQLGCFPQNKADSTPCGDLGEECWDAGCEAGVCVQQHTPVAASTPCTEADGTECTDAGCDGQGLCDPLHIPKADSTPCGDTGEECWDAGCEAGVCVQQHVPVAASTPCGDTGEDCYDAGCDGQGSCDQLHVDNNTCGGVELCRTPGFWGARGGDEHGAKDINITQAVIDAAPGGALNICGMTINNTNATEQGDPQSALEAICTSPKGTLERQLVRQLTAAALNCVMSGGSDVNNICDGISIGDYFGACNADCAAGTADASYCIGALDCFNNGGFWDGAQCVTGFGECVDMNTYEPTGPLCDSENPCAAGEICDPFPSCHDLPLCQEDELPYPDGLCFDPPGPASSPKGCNIARKNDLFLPN